MKRYITIFILFLALHVSGTSQDILYKNYTYVTNIRSVKLSPAGQPLELPVVQLSGGRLHLSFDDLTDEYQDYTYKIIHCTRDWEPSDISDIEYISGFQNEEIRDYTPSQNTFIPYINYRLTLPNEDLKWTISGNYLLVVYEGEDESDRIPVITRRFVVIEDKLKIVSTPTRPISIKHYSTHHTMDMFLKKNKTRVSNAQRDISVSILQNGRWDQAKENIAPLYETGDQIIIENRSNIAFEAHREFRPLDIRSLDFASEGIDHIELNKNRTDVIKLVDKPRKGRSYLFRRDANGHYIIQNKDGGKSDSNGDYANVHFFLDYPEGYDIYVAGEFSDYEPDELYKMTYNPQSERYEADILLKQGYYDYTYGIAKEGKLDFSAVEGSAFETRNDYNVITYFREPGSRYDRAIAYTVFNYSLKP